MKKKRIGILIVILVLAGALAMGIRYQCKKESRIDADDQVPEIRIQKKPDATARASLERVMEWYEAVGTVRPRTETRISSQIAAQVTAVRVKPGDKVKSGQILVVLDHRRLASRLDQARQTAAAAKAALTRAEAAYNRVKTYYDSQAATAQSLETAEEALIAARAGVRRSEEMVREAKISLGYTTIRSPEPGEVLKKLVEPGNTALPGKPLIVLQTTQALRLEAHVREGLIHRVKMNSNLWVEITALNHQSEAFIEEIVPYADPRSRTFLVKAALPPMDGLHPGMFGKLKIPVKEKEVVLIPRASVRKIGQLELVSVKTGPLWTTRYIKTGRIFNDKIEVLSGLSGKELIGIYKKKT
jgi:RND family efflux transporter MFP subunit